MLNILKTVRFNEVGFSFILQLPSFILLASALVFLPGCAEKSEPKTTAKTDKASEEKKKATLDEKIKVSGNALPTVRKNSKPVVM